MPGVEGVCDVLQETNLVLWEKRGKFQPGSNFGAWAFTIARLEVKTHRRRLRKQGVPLLGDELLERLAERLAERTGESEERMRALEGCLGRLNGKERELVELRYSSSSTLEKFAIDCGRSAESLRVTLFRIRAALKKCINAELAIKEARS